MSKIVLIVVFLLFQTSILLSEELKAIITIGDNLNLRTNPNIEADNSIDKLNKLEILKPIEYFPKNNSINPKDKWVKVKYKDKTGWLNSYYTTEEFSIDDKNNIAIWAQMQSAPDGAENEYKIVIYDMKRKKTIKESTEWISTIEFSSDKKYYFIDAGSDIIRSLSIYSIPDGKELYSCSYNGDVLFARWVGDNELYFIKATQVKVSGSPESYELEDMVFKNGKVESRGNKRIFNYCQ